MAKKKSGNGDAGLDTAHYKHTKDKRKNIPPAKIAAEGTVPRVPKAVYHYSPHLPPILRFDPTGRSDKLPELIAAAGQRALKPDEQRLIADALRTQEPWLEWATKREQHEKGKLEVDPVALHIHERVSAEAIVRTAMREDVQRDLFADPQQPYKEAVQFYKHDVDWANRLILGDSLQVMSSLARREGLAGKVQMIYMDPPYGIKFASNFQPEVGTREVTEKGKDLSREAETVRAYRDTWTLGTHSYLAYLRDRLMACRVLLADSGSIFVQINDENLHRVRSLMDEVFGPRHYCGVIAVKKAMGLTSELIASVCDYILWYAKDRTSVKYRQLYRPKVLADELDGEFRWIARENGSVERAPRELADGDELSLFRTNSAVSPGVRANTTGPFTWNGMTLDSGPARNWKTTIPGMIRLLRSDRIEPDRDPSRCYKQFWNDFPFIPLTSIWDDVRSEQDRIYVVQTSARLVERCMLMSTDPGDLVLDPTCGSGTTAFVGEQWGRRWITMDTSRVALSLARQRLVCATFEHYKLAEGTANPADGFVLRKVPHLSLSDIGNNAHLDAVLDRHDAVLGEKLGPCNRALRSVSDAIRQRCKEKLRKKEHEAGKRAITEADRRRWDLPTESFTYWTVPFDVDPDWPKPLQEAVSAYRKAWRSKMEEVNTCIAANCDAEELVDQPEIVSGVVRVTGPFTVEGVRPEELSLGDEGLFDATPNEWEQATHLGEGKVDAGYGEPKNNVAYLTRMLELLKQDGVTFLGNKTKKFARLEPLFEAGTPTILHAEGAWEGSDDHSNVAVGFGPQYGPVTALQVEELIRAARRYDELIIAGFSFNAEASAAIEEAKHPKLRVHSAHIRPDVNPAMEGLLKDTPRSQLFSVFGQPEINVKHTRAGWVCKLTGVDIYDPISNTVRSTGADKVAAWFLDSDFDGRCFCITQAFFPDKGAWDKIAAALKGKADEEAFEKLSGTTSIPFEAGKHKRIAVKVIDPRGNEVMAIKRLEV